MNKELTTKAKAPSYGISRCIKIQTCGHAKGVDSNYLSNCLKGRVMSFSIGNNVIHKKKPEWGIGIISNVIDQLKVKVVFNNQVEKTITNASDFLAIVTNNTCLLCLKECQHDEILSNGWSYHKVCFDNELSIIKKHSCTKINNLLINMEIQRIVDENKRIEQQTKDKKILVHKYRNLLYSLVIGMFKHVSVEKS